MKKFNYLWLVIAMFWGTLPLATFAFYHSAPAQGQFSPTVVPTAIFEGGRTPEVKKSPKPSPRPEISQRLEEKNQKRTEKQQTKIEKKREQLKKFWEKMVHRLGVLIRNEERLANKVQEKLNQAALRGKDVTALNKKLEDAKKLVADAKKALSDAPGKVLDIIKNSEPKVAREKIKALVKEVRQKIKDAHRALVNVRKELKGLKGGPSPSPSPSISPSVIPTPSAS